MICGIKCRTASKSRRLVCTVSIEAPSQLTDTLGWNAPLFSSVSEWIALSIERPTAEQQRRRWATRGREEPGRNRWTASELFHCMYFSCNTMRDLRLGKLDRNIKYQAVQGARDRWVLNQIASICIGWHVANVFAANLIPDFQGAKRRRKKRRVTEPSLVLNVQKRNHRPCCAICWTHPSTTSRQLLSFIRSIPNSYPKWCT